VPFDSILEFPGLIDLSYYVNFLEISDAIRRHEGCWLISEDLLDGTRDFPGEYVHSFET